jgi:hypothetical protein
VWSFDAVSVTSVDVYRNKAWLPTGEREWELGAGARREVIQEGGGGVKRHLHASPTGVGAGRWSEEVVQEGGGVLKDTYMRVPQTTIGIGDGV